MIIWGGKHLYADRNDPRHTEMDEKRTEQALKNGWMVIDATKWLETRRSCLLHAVASA